MTKRRIGNYTYSDEDKLGHGEFSDVYLATKDGQSGGFAIKLFIRGASTFHRNEIKIYKHIGKKLNPHILRFIESGKDDDNEQFYIVFQQAQEETLRDQINQMSGKPFGIERTLAILSQIGSAVIAIHDENINVIHGDIRPENILFDRNNQALLADFSIAVQFSSKDEKEVQSSPQGDPLYMAPERFGDANILRRESDQYALGCIAYELLTGRHLLGPVTHLSTEMIKQKLETEKYHNLCEYNELLPSSIEKVILKALDKNAEERYGSVKEFIDALIASRTVIGYGKRYPTQPPVLENLEMPGKGYLKHLTDFFANNAGEYTSEPMTNDKLIDPFTYTHVTSKKEKGGVRNLLYIPVEFIVNPDRMRYYAVHGVISQFLGVKDPTLIFYDSFEVPALKIVEISDREDTLQAGIWFLSKKYIYDFDGDEKKKKAWVEEIWEMTRSYKERCNS